MQMDVQLVSYDNPINAISAMVGTSQNAWLVLFPVVSTHHFLPSNLAGGRGREALPDKNSESKSTYKAKIIFRWWLEIFPFQVHYFEV